MKPLLHTTEAIILAGGKGSRLQSVLSDVPKPMAPIGATPFLSYLMRYLIAQGVQRIILSVGYKYEHIQSFYGSSFEGCDLVYVVEDKPLGTGGAIKTAMSQVIGKAVWVFNGDSFLKMDLRAFEGAMQQNHKAADVAIAIKYMDDCSRYGRVEVDADNKVLAFKEKQAGTAAYINAGVYHVPMALLSVLPHVERFSFEKEVLEKPDKHSIVGVPTQGFFIDIGIPKDYEKAQSMLPQWAQF